MILCMGACNLTINEFSDPIKWHTQNVLGMLDQMLLCTICVTFKIQRNLEYGLAMSYVSLMVGLIAESIQPNPPTQDISTVIQIKWYSVLL